ncbi:hypothetical protein J6590_039413 [Homalodisca vitripennis]|nr:hypothetical protein J6590_039413 [Homalodisca vitripennis]
MKHFSTYNHNDAIIMAKWQYDQIIHGAKAYGRYSSILLRISKTGYHEEENTRDRAHPDRSSCATDCHKMDHEENRIAETEHILTGGWTRSGCATDCHKMDHEENRIAETEHILTGGWTRSGCATD